MPIFKVKNLKVNLIKERKIDLERNIQRLTEENLDIILVGNLWLANFESGDFLLTPLPSIPKVRPSLSLNIKKIRVLA